MFNAMVTYSLWRVCGRSTATLIPQTVRRPSVFYANRTATSRSLASRTGIASLAVFCYLDIKLFIKNHNAATPQPQHQVTVGGLTVALRWPWGGIRFLPCLGCLENRTAASRRPCAGLTAPLRQPYGKLVVVTKTMRVPYGRRAVPLWSPYGFWHHISYDRRTVAVAFVTIAHKTLRLLKIPFHDMQQTRL